MDPTRTSRRSFLSVAATLPIAGATLAACGSSGPSDGTAAGDSSAGAGGGAKGTASYWFLSGPPGEAVRTASVKAFNQKNPDTQIKFQTYQNDPYKAKIKTALGAGQAPTIIWGWGGGGLREYVKSDQVEDLTSWFDENPDVKDRLFPSAFGAATIEDKIYAMPGETVQPIVLYWNKQVFDKVGVEPPKSWGDIMDLVPKFNAKNIAPFALGGQSRWTSMMWLEFLFDRIGGPEVFQAVFDGEKNAWSNPDAIKALTEVQNLVKANGFIKGFSSITADSNADQALLYTGRAAMMLHGAWSYGIQKAQGGKFVASGGLGYMNFPPVDGGKGDPSDTVGNPGQYMSIYAKAPDEAKEIAKNYFKTGVLTDAEVDDWIKTGGVPIVKGTEDKFVGDDADFLKFVYGIASSAKVFAQSWDQALSTSTSEVLLDSITKLFQLSMTPQQFADKMNGTIGQ